MCIPLHGTTTKHLNNPLHSPSSGDHGRLEKMAGSLRTLRMVRLARMAAGLRSKHYPARLKDFAMEIDRGRVIPESSRTLLCIQNRAQSGGSIYKAHNI